MRTRLAVVSTVAATVGLAGASTVAYLVTSQVLNNQIDDSLLSAANNFGGDQPQPGPAPSQSSLCEALSSTDAPSPGQFSVQLVQADGDVCTNPSLPGVVLDQSDVDLPGTTDVRLADGTLDNGNPARIAYVRVDDGATLMLARDTEEIVSVLGILQLTLLGVTLLGALTALGLSRWTSRAGLRPITRFTQLAEDIAERGRVDNQLLISTAEQRSGNGDELDRLAQAFGTMTAALSDAEMRQRRLVADAGHELRTPLSSLRANIDLLRRSRRAGRPLPGESESQLLDDLVEQLRELSRLVDDVSELAAPHSTEAQFVAVRLDHCVESALARVRMRAQGHEFDVRLEPATVLGDDAELERAVVNLLDNAVKFSPAGSMVTVACADGLVTVTDRGAGIDANDVDQAFERFWRSPRARSMPGSGLGLAIVRDVADRHRGWATIEPHAGGGTVAKLFVPPLVTSPGDA